MGTGASKSGQSNGYVLKATANDDVEQQSKVKNKPGSRRPTSILKTSGSNKVSPTMEAKGRERSSTGLQTPSLSRKQSMRSISSSTSLASSASQQGNVYNPNCRWIYAELNTENISSRNFEFGVVVGKGYIGTVSLCRTTVNKYFAIKSMKKERILQTDTFKKVFMEKRILCLLKRQSLEPSPHSNGSFHVNFFGTFQDQTNVYIAMEYIPGGDLNRRLKKCTRFSLEVTKFYASEIFLAIEYLQSLNIVYRDLKPENILIDATGHNKLCDFGLSTILRSKEDRMHSFCGTPAYLSPEQLDGKLTGGYTHIVDWWSYGILIYELLVGKTPFTSKNRENDTHYTIFLKILKNQIHFPLGFNPHAKSFISSLCHADREQRLTSTAIMVAHPFFHSPDGTAIPWGMVANKRLIPPFVPKLSESTVGDTSHFRTKPKECGPKVKGGSLQCISDEFSVF